MSRDTSGRYVPGHAGTGGRPLGRIAKLRQALGELTGDGKEIAEGLAAIWRDPATETRDKLAAYELALSYLVGKPQQAIELSGDVAVAGRAAIDVRAALASLPLETIAAVNRALGVGGPAPALLEVGTDDE